MLTLHLGKDIAPYLNSGMGANKMLYLHQCPVRIVPVRRAGASCVNITSKVSALVNDDLTGEAI